MFHATPGRLENGEHVTGAGAGVHPYVFSDLAAHLQAQPPARTVADRAPVRRTPCTPIPSDMTAIRELLHDVLARTRPAAPGDRAGGDQAEGQHVHDHVSDFMANGHGMCHGGSARFADTTLAYCSRPPGRPLSRATRRSRSRLPPTRGRR
ncbi:hypothetical protein QJS66_13360 [Kocuria rhizophila]|nr:hypothetical protein QJS66_13360 [Kocuria rhizophila]